MRRFRIVLEHPPEQIDRSPLLELTVEAETHTAAVLKARDYLQECVWAVTPQ